MKIFETSRLILREYTYSDFDDLAKIICDPETMKHYNKPYDTNGVQPPILISSMKNKGQFNNERL